MKLIFMGSPQFAVPTLELLQQHHEIVAVYTQPPRPAGRGHKVTKSPVHQLAENLNIPVVTPVNFKTTDAVDSFINFNADIAVVVAYGLILPPSILAGTKYGCLNIHPSKLPRFRGAAPIHRTMMAGDNNTEVCIIKMDAGCDTGPVVARTPQPVTDNDSYGELHDRFAMMGAEMMLAALNQLAQNKSLALTPQSSEGACYAHKLTKADSHINWSQSGRLLLRQINAFSPKPGARATALGQQFKIISAELLPQQPQHQIHPPGNIRHSQDGNILSRFLY